MTTQTETKTKKIPDFKIVESVGEGKNVQVGVAFKHGKGGGFNLLIGDKRYSVFPTNSSTP
jgi:hypothetical protein